MEMSSKWKILTELWRLTVKKNNIKKNKNTAFLLDSADLGLSLGSGTGEIFYEEDRE